MRSAIPCLLAWASLLVSVEGYRPQVNPKEKHTTSDSPKPWLRTIYSTQKEIVTPTVIAGVTFSGKPKATPDPLEPWVSLDKVGKPKTIKPVIKNGRTEKGIPDYSTYFQSVTTRTYSYEELKAMDLPPNEPHEEEEFIDEDDTYVSLNPVVRCTPQLYFNKGSTKDVPSAPFCIPYEHVSWKAGETYFTTWYTHFFRDENSDEVIEKVRVHLSYVKEQSNEKGILKRDLTAAFYSSDWLKNVDGLHPIEVIEEWLQGDRTRKVVLSVQPENIPDDEFDPLEYGVFLAIDQGSVVFRHTKEELALKDAGITDNKWWYVAITMPTVVIIALVLMYFFLYANNNYRDFSDITREAQKKKRRVLGKVSEMKKFKNTKNHKYSELPSYKPSKQH